MSMPCKYIKEVFKYLYKASFHVKVEKYKFYSESAEYLRYILSSSRLTMSDNKTETIQSWLELNKFKDIQFFLDYTNFYHKFIFDYSDIIILLTCFI